MARLRHEIRATRVSANISQRTIARAMGWSHARYGRLENDSSVSVSVADLSTAAALLGLELSASLHPAGEPIADSGQQALVGRFTSVLAPGWRVAREVALPTPGDRRSWDMLLRLGQQLVGVEAETRIRDVQLLVRRIRARERDGGAAEVLIVLSDSAVNRRLLPELVEALGERFASQPRQILHALRRGERLPGSGVVLV